MNNKSFQKAINLLFSFALALGLLLPASSTLALPLPPGVPNDPGYDLPGLDHDANLGTPAVSQWHYHDTWGINVYAAWNIITTGDAATVVAILDTGYRPHDEDLDPGRRLGGYDFITNVTDANDLDGRDANPIDPGDGCPSNSSWQGESVEGIIGASSNNGAGITGINWFAMILPVRVIGTCGSAAADDIVDGMRWAAALPVDGVTNGPVANTNPADVIHVSASISQVCDATYQADVDAIIASGAVIVAAAGDTNASASNFPANCNGVISVGATDAAGNRATNSNYGPTVEISAPGVNVLSTSNTGTTTPASDSYNLKSGTSMAAAHVSGVVSLMFAANPLITSSQVLQILQKTAKAPTGGVSPCTISTCGSFIVNAGEAVRVANMPDLIITGVTLSIATPVPGQPFDVYIDIKNQGGLNLNSLNGHGVIYRNVYIDRNPATLPVDEDGCIIDKGDFERINFTAGVDSGQTQNGLSFPVSITTGLTAGAHAIYALADGGCSSEEGFEDNNSYAPIAVGGTIVNVEIGGDLKGEYPLGAGSSIRRNYAGVDSGPVKVESTSSVPIIAAIRGAWAVNGVTTSFAQLMGLPLEQLSNKYVFPGYNNVTLNEQLRIANVDTVQTTVTVMIGGVLRGTYTLYPPGSPLGASAVRVNYPGLDSGPVVVEGTAGVDIISAIREAWAVNGVTTSFVQFMGLPAGQLSNKYVFPAYNNVTLNEQLRIANVDTVVSTVTVRIGGVLRGTYTLYPPGSPLGVSAVRVNYPGLDSGPVIVEGTTGVDIISSIRGAWAVNGVTTSFSQLMGMPAGQLSNKYLFPAYNNVTLNEQLRISNVDTVQTSVTVTIGGVLRGTYTLYPPGSPLGPSAVRINYAGLDSGPVVVLGTPNVDIISAIREAWAANGVTKSFVQLMGLPAGQLSTTFLFPAYNNITLNEQLRFGVP